MLIHHWVPLSHYYLGSHLKGEQGRIRGRLWGNTSLIGGAGFYPQSLMHAHTGPAFWILTAVLVGSRWILRGPGRAADQGPGSGAIGGLLAFAGLCVVVPLGVLTIDPDRNAAVASVAVAPVVWLVCLLTIVPMNRVISSSAMRYVAAICVCVGVGAQCYGYTRTSEATRHRAEVEAVPGMYDRLLDVARRNGWRAPAFASEEWVDYLFPPAIDSTLYERHRVFLHAHEVLATDVTAKSSDEILAAVQSCDAAFLVRRLAPHGELAPYGQSIEAAHEAVAGYCATHLRALPPIRAMGYEVTPYVRDPAPPERSSKSQ